MENTQVQEKHSFLKPLSMQLTDLCKTICRGSGAVLGVHGICYLRLFLEEKAVHAQGHAETSLLGMSWTCGCRDVEHGVMF
jgi:hypothetical protein